MSSGVFSRTKYAASYGDGTNIHPIRVQPETVTAAIGSQTNAAPTGAVTNSIPASVGGSPRGNKLIARHITAAIAGTPPTGYSSTSVIRIPCLTAGFYVAAIPRATLNYLGTTWTVISRRSERPE